MKLSQIFPARRLTAVGAMFAATAGSWNFSSAQQARAEEPKSAVVETTLQGGEYLTYSDEKFYLYVRVPEDKSDAGHGKTPEAAGFTIDVRANAKGVQEIPPSRIECLGVTYRVPGYTVYSLGPKPQADGVYVESAPDPNGSGDVEVLILRISHAEHEPDISFELPDNNRVISTVRNGSSSDFTSAVHRFTRKLVLRNKSDQPFILKADAFTNLPKDVKWPLIVIPPRGAP